MTCQKQFEPGEQAKERQRAVLLAQLRKGASISTIRAREDLGIAHPAGRVHELRRSGYRIVTHRVSVADSSGKRHIVASYCLASAGGAV